MDFLDPICIVTPTGVECMSSPLKRHKRYGVSCVDEPPNPQMDALRAQLFSAIRSAVTNLSQAGGPLQRLPGGALVREGRSGGELD